MPLRGMFFATGIREWPLSDAFFVPLLYAASPSNESPDYRASIWATRGAKEHALAWDVFYDQHQKVAAL